MRHSPTIDDLRAFLDASPSPFHAAATATDRLRAAGFVEVSLAGGTLTIFDVPADEATR